MKLRSYLMQKGLGQRQFARMLGVTQGAVAHWLAGRIPVSAERAMQIERLTGGAVTAAELRPDLDWPQCSPPSAVLRSSVAHPAPPPGGPSFSGAQE
jgi:DNA-binding transcriptional regulator YdaS (Cro superfamily)